MEGRTVIINFTPAASGRRAWGVSRSLRHSKLSLVYVFTHATFVRMSYKPRLDSHPIKITEAEFKTRFLKRFKDPLYDKHRLIINELATIGWQAHQDHHKAPFTRKAGPEFKDPTYDLSVEWLEARTSIQKAELAQKDHGGASRVLVISGANRNDQSCAGEISKSRRLAQIAVDELTDKGIEVELLDLSQITSQYGKNIYPCKGCVSTAMPLCHWPCSCYPNYAADQVNDWMNEIYPMWVRAHGIMIITPVYWNQAPSGLKSMMDRLVCADGGNPDPTSTHGKKSAEAKKIEIDGWDFPRHLKGRLFSVFVHGDSEGVDLLGAALRNWLTDMNLIPASKYASLARYIGYYGPYATSHDELDKDKATQAEVRASAAAMAEAVPAMRAGQMQSYLPTSSEPRPK